MIDPSGSMFSNATVLAADIVNAIFAVRKVLLSCEGDVLSGCTMCGTSTCAA
jgi:hypothetical protein